MRKVIAALVITAALATPAGVASAAPDAASTAPVAAPSTGSAVDAGSANGIVNAFCALIYMLKIGSVDSSGGPKCGIFSA